MVELLPELFFIGDNRAPDCHHKHNDGNNAFGDFQFFFDSVFHNTKNMPRTALFNRPKVLDYS